MRCDKCGYRINKKEYNGWGECWNCANGLMVDEK